MAEPSVRDRDEQAAHRHGAGYWRRILIVNGVGALAAFGLLGGLVTTAPWSERWKALAVSFIYANSIGSVAALAMPRLMSRVADRSRTTRWIVRLAAIPILIVAGCLLAGVVLLLIGLIGPREYLPYLYGSLWISFVVGTAACLTVIAYETLRSQLDATSLALRTKQLDEERARKLAIEAQLASLESRVRPHFLFNTLNSIAALIHDDPPAAERMVGQLASLLRSSLDSGARGTVALDDELRVVRDYLAIERLRFGDRLRFTFDVPPGLGSSPVPPLSVQTLVENSVKYAVSTRREGATIVVRSARDNGRVRIDVEDDGPGFAPDQVMDGHGLALLRARLQMVFGDAAALIVDSRPGCTRVTVDVPAPQPIDA